MMSLNPCLICYRLVSATDIYNVQIPHDNDDKEYKSPCGKSEEKLTKFFHLIGRHLGDHPEKCRDGGESMVQFPFEQVIKSGLSSTCRECSLIVTSFCDLYDQMKTIELMLNWKVWSLKNIMLCAQRVPTRLNIFRKRIEQHNMGDVTVDEIIDWKKELIRKCGRKLKATFPRLTLERCRRADVKVTEVASRIHQMDGHDDSQAIVESPPSSSVHEDEDNPSSPSPPDSDAEVSIGVESEHDLDSDQIIHESKYDKMPAPELPTSQSILSQQATSTNHITTTTSTCLDVRRSRNVLEKGEAFPPQVMNLVEVKPISITSTHDVVIEELPKFANKQVEPEPETENVDARTSIGSSDPVIKTCILETFAGMNVPSPQIVNPQGQGTSESLTDHTRYKCTLCKTEFTRPDHYKRHYLNRHLGLRFKCEDCAKTFTQKDNLNLHQRRMHPVNGRTIPLPKASKVSKSSPANKASHKCSLCSKTLSSRYGLEKHYNTVHLNIRYTCHTCSKSFTQKGYRDIHVRKFHQSYKCSFCFKMFETLAIRDKHIRTKCPGKRSGIKMEPEDRPSTETYILPDPNPHPISPQLPMSQQ